MDFKQLVVAAHDKGGDEALVDVLYWWYENSNTDLQDEVCEHLEQLAYKIDPQDAERIVRDMRPYGQYWNMRQVKDFVEAKEPDADITKYYLVMNMAYNDYYDTARMFDLQEEPEFFYSIAHDFIYDADARPLKVEKYFNKK